MGRRIKKVKHRRVRYTVYDNKTDFPVIVCGTAEECARVMGVDMNTFYVNISSRKGRWTILTERGVDF